MRRTGFQNLLLGLGIAAMLLFCLGPFLYMVVVSFAQNVQFVKADVSYGLTFEHFKAVLTESSLHFPAYLRNSFAVSLSSAFISVFIAAMAAYAISRLRFAGRKAIFFFVLAASLFPQIGLVGYLFKLMTSLGWINTFFALLFPYIAWTLPLSLWILTSYFYRIPVDLEEAALVDGCSRWQILYRVVLPVALPGIFSVLLLAFIFAFNEFMFALMLTSDYHARTIPVGIAMFQGLHGQTPWGNIMAAAVVTTLPIVILTVIFQRRIISGLTQGAVKG